jgi:hypothetical protein
MMKRSLGQQIFFAIFGTFGRYVTNLKGTFAENVKKVKNQPFLLYSILSPWKYLGYESVVTLQYIISMDIPG